MWRRQWLRFIEGLWWRHVGGPQCQRVRKGPVLIGGDVLSARWVLFNTVGDDFCQTNIPWAFSNLWFIYFQNNYKTLWNSKWYTVGPFKFSIFLFFYLSQNHYNTPWISECFNRCVSINFSHNVFKEKDRKEFYRKKFN